MDHTPLPTVAYFTMEIFVERAMPTYSGGLGVLAGDTVRSAADLRVPLVAVTLLHRRGYLRQRLDATGWQVEEPADWAPEQHLEELPGRVQVTLEGRVVQLRAWRYEVAGVTGATVPVLFLDTKLPENGEYDRGLTDLLYGGDERYRLCQEVVLGIGGVRMLYAQGYGQRLHRFHLNEGHAALLGLELVEREAAAAGRPAVTTQDLLAVRNRCVFTTHTPVPAGHDQFSMELARQVLGPRHVQIDWRPVVCPDGRLNMTYLAMSVSGYVNGVAKRHAEVSRAMFAKYQIDAITNGVHAATWVSPPFAELFDRHIPDWRTDNASLRYALSLPPAEVNGAHAAAKRLLLDHVKRATGETFDPEVLTLGFARRATGYKRPDLLVRDPARLVDIARNCGRLQVVYAGKAHPRDEEGKRLIQQILSVREQLAPHVRLVYLQDYDVEQAKLLTAGTDVWLNTPKPPMEASGTSGMKAALNGVPSLSVLDGWWVEGCIEGVTGWSVGEGGGGAFAEDDATELYDKLERVVMPRFHREKSRFTEMMVHCISLNGSFFNTHRMLQQYALKAYLSEPAVQEAFDAATAAKTSQGAAEPIAAAAAR